MMGGRGVVAENLRIKSISAFFCGLGLKWIFEFRTLAEKPQMVVCVERNLRIKVETSISLQNVCGNSKQCLQSNGIWGISLKLEVSFSFSIAHWLKIRKWYF